MDPAQTIDLYGQQISYREMGEGPAIILVHGITSSSRTWKQTMPLLAKNHRVVAFDLFGHGKSSKSIKDCSLGAYASTLRDLTVLLEMPRATIVGHSLGGGIAMQFAYQFPERLERMVLVSAGGLGRDVNLALRAATLPGSELVMPLMFSSPMREAAQKIGGLFSKVGIHGNADIEGVSEGFASLGDTATRRAFIQTMRAVADANGQRVDALDRIHLTELLPTMVVWGARDRIIPVSHAHEAIKLMPECRLEIFEDSGHFPFNNHPHRFAGLIDEFISETDPADISEEHIRQLISYSAEESTVVDIDVDAA
ncbi:MAG: alpha/beta fold hydrolase [Solirubrobacterales bacterium]